MEEETGRSKMIPAHKQIGGKAGEIMQEGDKRETGGKQLSPETFIDFSLSLLHPRDCQINSERARKKER